MANIQAVGADGLTIVYLAASGTGEADDPFVSRYDINGLDLLATEASLLDAINKIPTFAYDASRLLVKTELAQPLTDSQLRAEPLEVLLNGTAITNTTFGATQSGEWTVSVDNQIALTDAELRAAPVAVTGDFYPTTQPISAIALPLPTGAATETTLGSVNDKLPTLSNGRVPVESNHNQPLTDAQLRASVVNVSVSNLPATQPVSTASLPLPTGAATAANQTTLIGHVDGIETALAGTISVNTQLNQPLTNAELRASAVPVSVANFPATQAVSAASLPLPTGAATAANQTAIIGHIDGIEAALSGTIKVNTQLSQPLTNTELRASAVPVSVNNFPASQPVTVSSLPLPTGAASESTLSALNAKIPALSSGRIPVDIGALSLGSSIEIINDTGNPIPVSGSVSVSNFPTTQVISGTVNTGLNQPLTDTQLRAAPIAVTGTFWQATQPVSLSSLPPLASGSNTIGAISNTSFEVNNFPSSFAVTQSGTWSVGITNFPETQTIAAVSLPLPTGAATSAKQDTLIGHVDGIEAALAGTIAVNTGLSQPLTNAELRASPLDVNIDVSGLAAEATLNSLSSKLPQLTLVGDALKVDANVSLPSTYTVEVNNYSNLVSALQAATLKAEVTNNVSVVGEVSLDPTGLDLATATNQADIIYAISLLTGKFNNTSDRLVVDGSQVTQPVSGTVTANTGLSQPLTDTQLRAAPIAVTGTFWQTTQPISAVSLPLPTGAASSSNQEATNSTLSSVNNKIPSNLTVVSTRLLVDGSGVIQPVSGTVTADTGLDQPLTDTQLRANPVAVTGTFWPETQPVSFFSLPAGTNIIGSIANTTFAATQSGSWSISVDNFPTTGATESTLSSLSNKVPNNLTVNNSRLVVDGSGVTQPVSGTVSANQSGNWNVKVSELPDIFPLSAFGEPEVVNPYPLVQVDFVYGINSKLGVTEVFGTGSATKEATRPHMVLATGASTNSWARYRTKRYLKYRSGQGLKVLFSTLFSTGVAGSIQVSGVFYIENQSNVPTIIDGYGFGYNETSFGILHANNGVLTWTPKEDFNIDKLDGNGPSGMVIDPTKFNLYQIKYPYLGVGTVFFYVELPAGGLVLVHTIQYPNNYSVAQLGNPNLAMQSLVYNSTNNTNIRISEVTKAGFISGIRRPLGPKISMDRVISLGNTNETHMFTIRCNTTINSLTNRSQIHLVRIGGANSGNNAVIIRLYRNATVTGTSFTNFDAVNSISAYSDAGTYTAATGEPLHSVNLGANTNLFEEIESFDDILEPGDTLTVTAQGRANGQVPQVSLIWVEDI